MAEVDPLALEDFRRRLRVDAVAGDAGKAAVLSGQLVAGLGQRLVHRSLGGRDRRETVLRGQAGGQQMAACREGRHPRGQPGFALGMKIVAHLARHLAADERAGPFRLELAAENFQRRKILDLSVALRAIQHRRLARGELHRNMAGKRGGPLHGERIQGRRLRGGETVARHGSFSEAVAFRGRARSLR